MQLIWLESGIVAVMVVVISPNKQCLKVTRFEFQKPENHKMELKSTENSNYFLAFSSRSDACSSDLVTLLMTINEFIIEFDFVVACHDCA